MTMIEMMFTFLLMGVVNPANKLGVEAGFAARRFRSLEELKLEKVEEAEAVV